MKKEANIRYNRHLILPEIGPEGQEKLMNARVLVIGAGGLGCPILSYLTAAGVGRIGIIDFDRVDISNLQRQVLFRTKDVGKLKATCAAIHLEKLNPLVQLDVYTERLTTKNALNLFEKYDLVIDGTDNFSTRYLVNDAAVLTDKPLVYGSIYKFQGQVSVFNYQNGPTYRCLFPTPPAPGEIPNCSEIGVIGVLPGIIGTQQANEAIKIILGIGEPLRGKLLIYDALNAHFTKVGFERNQSAVEEVLNRRDSFLSYDYDLFCGITKTLEKGQIDPATFQQSINQEGVLIVDLRESWEVPELNGENIRQLPMDTLEGHVEELESVDQVILVCQSGVRSAQMKTRLESNYQLKNLFELKGGVLALNEQ